MIVTAWSNGKNGFGLRMSARDRDLQINKEWKTVILHLEGHPNPVVATDFQHFSRKAGFFFRSGTFFQKNRFKAYPTP